MVKSGSITYFLNCSSYIDTLITIESLHSVFRLYPIKDLLCQQYLWWEMTSLLSTTQHLDHSLNHWLGVKAYFCKCIISKYFYIVSQSICILVSPIHKWRMFEIEVVRFLKMARIRCGSLHYVKDLHCSSISCPYKDLFY